MDAWVILLSAVLYIGLLFTIALAGDSRWGSTIRLPPQIIYSLALAVYCTSWTYYGAVGRAASSGWDFLPIYLGPVLMFVLGMPVIRKILRVAKKQNISSIADFISSRYGKRHGIAIATTLIATMAVIPYIALQLKAVTTSINIINGVDTGDAWLSDTTLLTAISMIAFAILFGTRQIDVTEHHRGMMLTIAFESMVKLAALVAVAIFAVWIVFSGPIDFIAQYQHNQAISEIFHIELSANFITQTLLAASAILCLPRQFHIMVVENTSNKHLKTARWLFPLYLLVISLVVLPISSAGVLLFPSGEMNADTFVLSIPIAKENHILTLFAFIGGFSAATAMIVVATLSLSTMLSNDVILPIFLRKNNLGSFSQKDFSPKVILIRRLAIIAIILLAYAYYIYFAGNEALTTIGLLSFSLVVQLLPALLGGIFWKRGNAYGVYIGLALGFGLWFLTLGLPTLIRGQLFSSNILTSGLFNIHWLRPETLFGITLFDPLTHSVVFSLGANFIGYYFFSKFTTCRLEDRLQAAAFVDMDDRERSSGEITNIRRQQVTVSDLTALLERFAGAPRAASIVADFEHHQATQLHPTSSPKLSFIRYIERVLAGIIGSSSSRAMVHSVLSGRQLGIEEVVNFFDETTQVIQFNQRLLSTTLENIDQGVSVIDRDLRLVAWNRSYIELFNYPEGFIRVGQAVEEIVRYNASRGECGPGEVEDHVKRRMEHLKRGSPHSFIRVRRNGTVLQMNGNPLPGGGFVTTFSDITEHVRAQEALRESKDLLEARVADRTRTIQEINSELRAEIDHREDVERELIEAKAEAERANTSKTRFLALASHDILQPLNAARLYTASLMESDDSQSETLNKLDASLQSSEELISTLLEIARLDDGVLKPKTESFALDAIMAPLISEFQMVASQKNLILRWVSSSAQVTSDPVYLRRILQNLISNAIKYTSMGKILVGARRTNQQLKIQVWDTGHGIERRDRQRVFNDFYRVEKHSAGVSGVGLGLGIVARLSQLLEHPMHLESWPGRGSLFQIQVPLSAHPKELETIPHQISNAPLQPLAGTRVLCVDNEQENLDALKALLDRWGCQVMTATNQNHAVSCQVTPDILIVDYQLGTELNGVSLVNQLRKLWHIKLPAILITANSNPEIRQLATENEMKFLKKPVKPAPLRALISNSLKQLQQE